ncbi:hypothetical protein N0V82_009929 [Gnomoniopsis sp. IMI 355080]|nr:hypothetical protein N0V82_009929 [Gnomoniopsis sp. IMI 355080]
MSALFLRTGLWLSLLVAVVAVLVRFQQPLQEIFLSEAPSQTFCYSEGITAKFSDNTRASCFTVKDGVFVDVFTPESEEPPVELQQGYAMPGLWDGHGHLAAYGEFLHSVDLFGTTSVEDVHNSLADYLAQHKGVGGKNDWVRGIGWDQMALGRMPTAAMLEEDERFKGLYIMLDRVDVHCIWVSQAVLDLLPPDLPDIPGGDIVRDPPGMGVFCDNAMEYVMTFWPKPNAERKTAFLKSAMQSLHSVGLVGMHDAGVNPDELQLYRQLAAAAPARTSSSDHDWWTLRVYAMIECRERNTFCPDEVSRYTDDAGLLSIESVKLFADGALGSWGSAMIEPYTDRPDTSGSLLVNGTSLTSLAKSWAAEGYQVNIHAIGDLANRLAIDALSSALATVCATTTPGDEESSSELAACQEQRRFRIEHAQIIHPDDQVRIKEIGILPSVQPTHATSDMKYAERRLGHERTAREAYRMRSLRDLGLVLGSDFPVEPINPFEGIYAAVTRRSPATGLGADGESKEGWHLEEALSLHEALTGFTEGPAWGGFMEGRAGCIQEGAWADWVVLDQPLNDLEELRSLKVKETWVGGRRVYARE